MASPAVSVLMTCRNRAEFLSAAIESVLAQSFGDFELIVSDDASTDGSLDVARAWAARDERVRVSANSVRLGDYPNRNHVASLARGEFLKYLDSDDLMYPYCIEVMVTLMRNEPRAEIGLSLLRRHTGGPVPMLLTPRMSFQREFLGSGLFSSGPGAAIMRRETFERLGGFTNAGNASDDLFWLEACANVNVLLLPADLTWYRIHQGRASNDLSASEDYFAVSSAAWNAISSPSCPLTAEERERAKDAIAVRLAKRMLRDLGRGRIQRAARRFRRSGIPVSEFVKHVRPLELDALAGTPLSSAGHFLIPDWTRFGATTADSPSIRDSDAEDEFPRLT